jgi:CTP:molybdopterin cytidylyltransferase MocA
LALVDFHFGSTGTPALIAKTEQLAQLARAPGQVGNRNSARAALRTLSQVSKPANDLLDDQVDTQTHIARANK